MAGVIKQSTNLTGLSVCQNPKHILKKYYRRILKVLDRMPENSVYKKNTEDIIKQRSSVLDSFDDIKSIEEKIGCGQIEEMITQAKNELTLAETFLLAKPWERLLAPIPKNQWHWPPK